jgi:protein TonB
VFVLALLLAIPIVQWTNTDDPEPSGPDTDTVRYESPDYEEPPPPPPPPKPEPIEEFKPEVRPPTISELEGLMLDPNLQGVGSGVPVDLPQGEISDPFVDIGNLTTPPRPLQQTPPVYPPEAKSAKLEGEVVVQFLVTPEGLTRNMEVLRSTNSIFNSAALSAVKRWRFTPGEKDGKIVTTRARITIPFTISR